MSERRILLRPVRTVAGDVVPAGTVVTRGPASYGQVVLWCPDGTPLPVDGGTLDAVAPLEDDLARMREWFDQNRA